MPKVNPFDFRPEVIKGQWCEIEIEEGKYPGTYLIPRPVLWHLAELYGQLSLPKPTIKRERVPAPNAIKTEFAIPQVHPRKAPAPSHPSRPVFKRRT